MAFWTPGGTKRFSSDKANAAPQVRLPLPSVVTQEEVMNAARSKEEEQASRAARPPKPSAVLEVVAVDVRRIAKRLSKVEARQAKIEQRYGKSFDVLKFLGTVTSTLTFAGVLWGDLIRMHPEIGATAAGGWVSAIFLFFQAKSALRRNSGREDKQDGNDDG